MGRWKGHGTCSADTLAIGHDIRGDGGWVRSHDAGPAKACTIRILGPDSQGAGAKGGTARVKKQAAQISTSRFRSHSPTRRPPEGIFVHCMDLERTPSKSPSRSPSLAPLTRKLSGLGARWFGGGKDSDSSSILSAMTDSGTLAELCESLYTSPASVQIIISRRCLGDKSTAPLGWVR